jgi:hypothetical protein
MTIDALRMELSAPADPTTDLELLAASLRAMPSPVALVHLHHYDSLGYLPQLWRQLLAELVRRGHGVLLSTCSGFDEEALDFLAVQKGILCQRRSNQGRCIGAYRDTALVVARLAAEGVAFRPLLLINDSILPLTDAAAAAAVLEELIALAAKAPAAALAGLTDSYATDYHLQSYALCANAALLGHPAWQGFWQALDSRLPKEQLICSGEIGLSKAMAKANVPVLPLYPLVGRLLSQPRVRDDLARLGDYPLNRINPTLFLWQALWEEGFPFVKKILLFGLPTRLGGPLGAHQLLAGLSPGERAALTEDLHHLLLGRAAAAAHGQAAAAAGEASAPAPVPPRLEELRRHVGKEALGLEIGPLHRPVCPKREGFNCLSADILSREQLLQAYAEDPEVMPLQEDVEEVDVLLTEGLLAGMQAYCESPQAQAMQAEGSLAYLISSHNLEHLPDPIAFLDDAAVLLAPGGHLTMAIPVGSRCFDCFRPLSSTGQLIDAHQERRTKPTLGALFDHSASVATDAGGRTIGDRTYDIEHVAVSACGGTIDAAACATLQFTHEFGHSGGIHSFVFNPYSFLLIFEDLQACGYLPLLRILQVLDRPGNEFIVHIVRISEAACCPLPLTAERRTELLKQSIIYAIDDLRFSEEQELINGSG